MRAGRARGWRHVADGDRSLIEADLQAIVGCGSAGDRHFDYDGTGVNGLAESLRSPAGTSLDNSCPPLDKHRNSRSAGRVGGVSRRTAMTDPAVVVSTRK